jgi:4-hydroxy-tetrahydrodipicolinate reductase
MDEFKIGVVGAAGRMGRMLVREVAATEGCRLAGAVEAPGSPEIGRDAGEIAGLGPLGVAVGDDAVSLFAYMDAVLEFTAPAATVEHAALAAQGRAIHVIGTTALDPDQAAAVARAAQHTAIVWAPNMSAGINLLLKLTEELAGRLGEAWDIEVLEMHHRHKVDAPSGTALALGRAAAAGRGVVLDAVAERGRDGITGERRAGAIGFAALRGGDVFGDHTVIFATGGERIELTHRAAGREIYARGAVQAAIWARGRPPGLYDMADVLGLNEPLGG